MELSPHGSVRRVLDTKPEMVLLSMPTQLAITQDIVRAMAFLHRQRPLPMYHGDLKCANVLLWDHKDRGMLAKLADFGMVKGIDDSSGGSVSRVAGTLTHKAPEMFNGSFLASSEVYAFAITLWEILTGDRPWREEGLTEAALIKALVFERKRPPMRLSPGQVALGQVVESCWDQLPSHRPSFAELEKHLKAVELAGESGEVGSLPQLSAPSQRRISRASRKLIPSEGCPSSSQTGLGRSQKSGPQATGATVARLGDIVVHSNSCNSEFGNLTRAVSLSRCRSFGSSSSQTTAVASQAHGQRRAQIDVQCSSGNDPRQPQSNHVTNTAIDWLRNAEDHHDHTQSVDTDEDTHVHPAVLRARRARAVRRSPGVSLNATQGLEDTGRDVEAVTVDQVHPNTVPANTSSASPEETKEGEMPHRSGAAATCRKLVLVVQSFTMPFCARVLAYPMFYALFFGLYLSYFLAMATKSGGVNADFPTASTSLTVGAQLGLLPNGTVGGAPWLPDGKTCLPLPKYYDLDNDQLQSRTIPVVYGLMHASLVAVTLMPVPMCHYFWTVAVKGKPFVRRIIPTDDFLYFHQLLGVLAIGGVATGAILWLLTMVPACARGGKDSCLAFVMPPINPLKNVLILRILIAPLWGTCLPLITFARYPLANPHAAHAACIIPWTCTQHFPPDPCAALTGIASRATNRLPNYGKLSTICVRLLQYGCLW